MAASEPVIPPVPLAPVSPLPPPVGVSPTGGTDWRSKGFDFASEATKQLITVATGVLTAAVIFSKDIAPDAKWWALGAWAFLTLSVICGILVLLNMSGHLTRTANTDPSLPVSSVVIGNPNSYALPNLYLPGIRTLSSLQCLFFVIGLCIMSVFGFQAIAHAPADAKPIIVNCPAPASPAPLAPVVQKPSPPPDTPTPHKEKSKLEEPES